MENSLDGCATTAARPNLYRGVLLDVALRQLHREGKAHDPTECPTCREEQRHE
jgi:hypothetical protein